MDRNVAERLMQAVVDANECVGRMDIIISETDDNSMKKMITHGVGKIIAALIEDIIIPVSKEYPDLNPFNTRTSSEQKE